MEVEGQRDSPLLGLLSPGNMEFLSIVFFKSSKGDILIL